MSLNEWEEQTLRERFNVFDLMSLDNHLVTYVSEQNLTGAFIIRSIEDFLSQKHTLPVVIVWDNGPIHPCKAVYECLVLQKPYSFE